MLHRSRKYKVGNRQAVASCVKRVWYVNERDLNEVKDDENAGERIGLFCIPAVIPEYLRQNLIQRSDTDGDAIPQLPSALQPAMPYSLRATGRSVAY
jgi:hypothetical protein